MAAHFIIYNILIIKMPNIVKSSLKIIRELERDLNQLLEKALYS